jgi:hypothetical protein
MFFGFASDLSYDYTEYKPQGFFLVLRCFQSLRLFIAILDMKPDRNRIYHIGCHASAPDLIGIRSVSTPPPPPAPLLASLHIDVLLPIWVWILSLQPSAL